MDRAKAQKVSAMRRLVELREELMGLMLDLHKTKGMEYHAQCIDDAITCINFALVRNPTNSENMKQ